MTPVISGAIHAVGYDYHPDVLRGTFKSGCTYKYFDVAPHLYEKMLLPHPWPRIGARSAPTGADGSPPNPPFSGRQPSHMSHSAAYAAQAACCYAQARAVQARTVVEFGTSFEVSALWLAAAVRDNGGGTVIGHRTRRTQGRAGSRARAGARLKEYVDTHQADVRETLRDLPRPVDFLLNDGWPEAALDVLKLVTPAPAPVPCNR